MSTEDQASDRTGPMKWLASIGPAIIVASVVMGPGSILVSSRVGAEYGYAMLWVLVLSVILMIAMVALCTRLGIAHHGSMCDELASSVGRPATVFVGIIIFLIIACFQTSNNVAILAVIEPLFELTTGRPAEGSALQGRILPAVILVGFNGFVVVILFSFRNLYKKLERLMKATVGLMMIAFLANLVFARPSLLEAVKGLAPSLPEGGMIPEKQGDTLIDPLWAVTGMIMTTFSVAGAFYQSYLVRERGWTLAHVKQGARDSVVGITTLGMLSAMIMMTSSAVLYRVIQAEDIRSISDVSRQIEPLFGPTATFLFSVGIFAGAFNPFIVNAIIGGTVFSDSLGLGSRIDDRWPKVLTTAALGVGMVVALLSVSFNVSTINVIVFAQALTVLGIPVLTIAVMWLAVRPGVAKGLVPLWMKVMCGLSIVLTIMLATRTAYRLYLQLT